MPWRAIDAFGSDDCTEGLELPILCGGFRTTDVTVRDAFCGAQLPSVTISFLTSSWRSWQRCIDNEQS